MPRSPAISSTMASRLMPDPLAWPSSRPVRHADLAVYGIVFACSTSTDERKGREEGSRVRLMRDPKPGGPRQKLRVGRQEQRDTLFPPASQFGEGALARKEHLAALRDRLGRFDGRQKGFHPPLELPGRMKGGNVDRDEGEGGVHRVAVRQESARLAGEDQAAV